ncbi:CcmD family protein [Mucilaginibacter achroorhodeus]|uniref:CcmD family protein n=1 Tax=Mucilaginibacter achroorhodeus TaxID=2599294 RepID=A0A563U2R3_9SPHI|nr:CcmD family protein [Mucilaginibacter achroorhodeus]TWR25634.1 CcmD family protein [Mucilaginibacter achroorhodeus]
MKKLAFLLSLIFCFTAVSAQQTQSVEMADVLRSSGKIYVVIATICIIFIGLALYLFSIDRRLKKIEKEN